MTLPTPSSPAVPTPVRATAVADRTSLRLSDSLTVTVSVSGPAPLRVELPKDLLTEESAAVWKIEQLGPATLAEDGNGSARWEQPFRLSPFVPGEAVPIGFRPIRVGDQSVTPDPLSVQVVTSLTSPKADDTRPVTDVESLPSPPPSTAIFGPAFVAGVIAIFAAAVVFALVRRKVKPKQPSPHEWATGQLGSLDAERMTAVELADRLTQILRGYLSRRFALTVNPFTTAELLVAGDTASIWSPDTRATAAPLLAVFDRVKFAGHEATPTDQRQWCLETGKLIATWETPENSNVQPADDESRLNAPN
jgi:hypothetical protein